MAYLATTMHSATVTGIDGVPQALDAFVQEHPQLGLVQQSNSGSAAALSSIPHVYYSNQEQDRSTTLELLVGDFFSLAPVEPRSDFIFDRASMVAIHPTLRQAYVDVLDERVLSSSTNGESGAVPTILLVAFERTSGTDWDKEGPPFSLPLADIEKYYTKDRWTVTLLEDKGAIGEINANLGHPMISKYYQIRRKNIDETKEFSPEEL